MISETIQRLLDALDACDAIERYIVGMDETAFERNAVVQDAVAYRLIVVGEALNRAAQTEAAIGLMLPDLRGIVALRNRVVHAYHTIDDEVLWDIVRTKLPSLRQQLRGLIDGQPRSGNEPEQAT